MGLRDRLEKIFAAAAFAESGEYETAREVMKEAGGEDESPSSGIRPVKIDLSAIGEE